MAHLDPRPGDRRDSIPSSARSSTAKPRFLLLRLWLDDAAVSEMSGSGHMASICRDAGTLSQPAPFHGNGRTSRAVAGLLDRAGDLTGAPIERRRLERGRPWLSQPATACRSSTCPTPRRSPTVPDLDGRWWRRRGEAGTVHGVTVGLPGRLGPLTGPSPMSTSWSRRGLTERCAALAEGNRVDPAISDRRLRCRCWTN